MVQTCRNKPILKKLASGELIGCFGLTEPEAGSDPAGMRTTAIKTADGYRINGSKTWISNASIADIFIIWAKSEEDNGEIKGFNRAWDKRTPNKQN